MHRVLQVVPDMNAGGIENYIMNMYRSVDRERLQFDFLVHHRRRGFFDDEIEEMGGRIYRIPVLDDKNIISYMMGLRGLFASGDWKVVHGHAASLASFYLGAAERAGVPVRIAHSHGTSYLRTPKGYMKRLLFTRAKVHANVRLACSTEAGRYLFGKESFYLAKNAIVSERFAYDEVARMRVRNSFGISDDELLVGHVGRYNLQKNHTYVVETFAELKQLHPASRLLLVGTGELRESIAKQVKELSLTDSVIMQDVTSEPEAFYSAMDVFVLPSLFEGLPLVGIEAQCSGLPCLFSSEITRETQISNLATFIPLADGPREWARTIVSTSTPTCRLCCMSE